jgi:hypothetical protein
MLHVRSDGLVGGKSSRKWRLWVAVDRLVEGIDMMSISMMCCVVTTLHCQNFSQPRCHSHSCTDLSCYL